VGLDVRSFREAEGPVPLQTGKEPRRITSEILRVLPFGELVARGLVAGRRIWSAALPEGAEGEVRQARGGFEAADPSKGGRPRLYPDSHYARVALLYAQVREAPTKAVAERFGVSRSAAAKWVARCRERGLLLPANSARAEEQQDRSDGDEGP
jgi:hypothetical protein